MNDRARALTILREARDLAAQRLTERVLDAAEAILDDARGDSYMGEIDSLYEQVGMRMVHLSQMISHLPVENDSAPSAPGPASAHENYSIAPEAAGEGATFVADTMPALLGPVYIATPALPAPAVRGNEGTNPEPVVTFQTFVAQICADNLERAGQLLAILFGMSSVRGQRCAAHFAQRMRRDPQFLQSALQLRDELHVGSEHGALVALHQCFGLAGLDAITVLNHLRQRLAE